MKSSSLSRPFATAVLCSSLLSTFLAVSAYADTYHAVQAGETIGSIAKQYNISSDALRSANQLSQGDNSRLGSMLLRIPGAGEKSAQLVSKSASTPAPRASSSAARYFGSVTKYVSYTVRAGDSLESIATAFSSSGQTATASEIRTKNNLAATPAAGTVLLIPVTTTYEPASRTAAPRASNQVTTQANAAPITRTVTNTPVAASSSASNSSALRQVSAESGDSADVSVSAEMDLPFARAIPAAGSPVYTSPGTRPNNKSEVVTATDASTPAPKPRGNVLASRGGFIPSPNLNNRNLDGARILQNGETLVTTPTPRVTRTPQPTSGKMARVAKVVHTGARIRRLPEAGAITLYNCGTGTELAILKQSGAWSAVLMSDRSTGWMPTRYIRFTGTSVDISTQVVTDEDRNDDTAGDWQGGYNSNHPAVRYALQWLGTRYVYGGQSRRGIDCSSLVQKSFASCGIRLPRVSRDQARVGRPVAPENLQPGDRLYFSASGTHVDHTGIYMGNGLFVHASGSARQVTVSRLSDRRNWNIFVSARR